MRDLFVELVFGEIFMQYRRAFADDTTRCSRVPPYLCNKLKSDITCGLIRSFPIS